MMSNSGHSPQPRAPKPASRQKWNALLLWALFAINLALCVYNLLIGRLLSAGYTFSLSVVWALLALNVRRRLKVWQSLLLFLSLLLSLVLIYFRYAQLVRPH